ncbi:MAG: hypothetical protein ABI760_15010, partial [Ferruginibacter sp.]
MGLTDCIIKAKENGIKITDDIANRLTNQRDSYVKEGKSEREADLKAIDDYHKELHDRLNSVKEKYNSTLSKKEPQIRLDTYVPHNPQAALKEIHKKYDAQLGIKEGSSKQTTQPTQATKPIPVSENKGNELTKEETIALNAASLGDFDNEIRGVKNQRRIPNEVKQKYLDTLKGLAERGLLPKDHPSLIRYPSLYDIVYNEQPTNEKATTTENTKQAAEKGKTGKGVSEVGKQAETTAKEKAVAETSIPVEKRKSLADKIRQA